MVRSICCYLSNWPRLSDQPHMTQVFVQVSDVLDYLSIPITIVRSRRNKKQDWNAGMVIFQSWRGCGCRNLNHQMNTSKLLTWFFQYTNNKQSTSHSTPVENKKQQLPSSNVQPLPYLYPLPITDSFTNSLEHYRTK